jgi:asparagine synthase (glutamine-hydrolysing)
MCGILSYYKKEGLSKDDIAESIHSLASINHRGPDGEGVCLINTKTKQIVSLRTPLTPSDYKCDVNSFTDIEDGKFDLLFGHKRLSIFDVTTAGHQPMIFEEGLVILFNGEVYNFWEIREDLKEKGYVFKTNSDTEVIVRAYQEWGEACLNKFNGMWAIIIYDSKKNKLFISKDRFGVKPLYFIKNTESLIFASEIKQFRSFKKQTFSLNKQSIQTFIDEGALDYDDTTFYNEVTRYKSGFYSSYFFDNHKMVEECYYTLPSKTVKISQEDAFEEYNRLFSLAVSRRMRADVKIGVAISGGVDSSAILYHVVDLLKDSGNKVNTFSAIFPGMEGDESNHIKIIENDLKDKVNVFYTNPYEEFTIEDLVKHIYHQDFPTASASNYAEWAVARMVKQNGVTVLLGGQGGDEVFAGYHQHFFKYCRQIILSGNIFKYLSVAKNYADIKSLNINRLHLIILGEVKTAMSFKLGLSRYNNRLDTDWLKANKLIESLKLDALKYQLPWYLRSDDRDFMAFGVETRHPFLDVDLVNFGYQLPDEFKIRDGWQKWIVRKNMTTVPDSIRFRKDKKGYTIPQKKFKETYRKDLMKYQSYVADFDPKLADSAYSFRLSALGIWLHQNNSISGHK